MSADGTFRFVYYCIDTVVGSDRHLSDVSMTQSRPFATCFWLLNSGRPFMSLERPVSGVRK